jgi:hypothetical protein
MDFLFGLDMLKRHRCNIDLSRNVLVLTVNGLPVDAPFLHEHQLDVNKVFFSFFLSFFLTFF